jgi:hypothetical protein
MPALLAALLHGAEDRQLLARRLRLQRLGQVEDARQLRRSM